MAWEKGTAASYRDLLEKLKVFASANGWTVERWVKDAVDPVYPERGEDELVLSTVGNSGQEIIFLGFKTVFDSAKDIYNLKMYVSPLYSEGAQWEMQPGKCQTHIVYLWQNAMNYVICLDADHIKFACQVAGTTHCGYAGKVRGAYSLGHWPRQMVCFGEGKSETSRWSSQGDGYSNFQLMRNNPRSVLKKDGTWYEDKGKTFPSQFNASHITNGSNYDSGETWMLPLYYVDQTLGAIGEFIGCYYMSGDRVITGQQFHSPDGGQLWLCSQNIYRNGFRDFMAWELI